MNRRKRILVLTSRYPYPVIGGDRLRIFEVSKALAKQHDLTLLSLCESDEEMKAPPPEDGVFTSIKRVYLPKWRSRLNALSAIPGKEPLQIAYYRSAKFSEQIKTLLPQHDLCLAHLIRTGDYVRNATVPSILEMTDAISLNYKRVRETGSWQDWRSILYGLEAKRLLSYERKIIDDFTSAVLVSEYDRNFLLQGHDMKGREKILVCSNGVDLDHLPFVDRQSSAPVGVFIGNMNSAQNLDACTYFAETILPRIRQKIDFRFRVVGRISEVNERRLAAFEGVEVAANVESIPEAVSDARIGIAPVRLGAGVQNKVLEYMALGLPAIVSPVALEGLAAKAGRDCLLAATPEAYVENVELLWSDSTVRTELAEAGYAYVKTHHAWSAKLKPLLDVVDRL